MTRDIMREIQETVTKNPIVLYMKGTKAMPQCGFSAAVVQALAQVGVSSFVDVNILADAEMRDAIKQYSDWPTIPQLYIAGEFIGGCDIVREMHAKGELAALIKKKIP